MASSFCLLVVFVVLASNSETDTCGGLPVRTLYSSTYKVIGIPVQTPAPATLSQSGMRRVNSSPGHPFDLCDWCKDGAGLLGANGSQGSRSGSESALSTGFLDTHIWGKVRWFSTTGLLRASRAAGN